MKTKLHGKEIKFCRWGGLSPVKQKGYNPKMPSYHSPPMRKGIYAFVWPYIDTFFLYGEYDNNHIWKKETSFSEKWEEETPCLQSSKIFKYNGPIWHHLGHQLKSKQRKRTKGHWCLSSYYNYVYALQKELHRMKSDSFQEHHKVNGIIRISSNNPTTWWGKDHLEVFIERI